MKLIIGVFAILILLSGVYAVSDAAIDIPQIINNMEKNDKQSVLSGHIDSLTIKRGLAEWRLGPGELTLFDFGTRRTVAMVYSGKGRFDFTAPNEIERGQILKFTGNEMVDDKIQWASFVFTVPLEAMPDTLKFRRAIVSEDQWDRIYETWFDAFNHLDIYLSGRLMEDLVSEEPGNFFYADFKLEKIEHLAFCETPFGDDYYRLYNLIRVNGRQAFDVLCGYSPDDGLVSHRNIIPIDIKHYQIESEIANDGGMSVNCRIYFDGKITGKKYIHFQWYRDNEIVLVVDSHGDTLEYVSRGVGLRLLDKFTRENRFGILLKRPIVAGENDFVDISFRENLENTIDWYRLKGIDNWYPKNRIRDCATYDMRFYYPAIRNLVASGDCITFIPMKEMKSKAYVVDNEVSGVSFYLGSLAPFAIAIESSPVVEVSLQTGKTAYDEVGADITNSLSLFTYLFGQIQFDTIRVIEDVYESGASSPGLIRLSRSTFYKEDVAGWQAIYRASLIANQWCGNQFYNESYRDEWIIDGLSTYCGYWFYELSSKNPQACKDLLFNIRRYIFTGRGPGSQGSKAGSMTLGYRLNCSKSKDFYPNLCYKAAYCFHMLRYLMHDFTTNSDDKFKAFLKDLASSFKDKPITTADFRVLTEKYLYPNMDWFFDQWIYGTDIPDYTFAYKTDKVAEDKYKVTCHVKQENVPDKFQMMIPLTVEFGADKKIDLQIFVKQPEQEIVLPYMPSEPTNIIFNAYDAVLCNTKYE